MSHVPTGTSAASFGPYVRPVHGDLVFFEHKPDWLSNAVANLDWPQPVHFKVAHVGIVDAQVSTGVSVIANVFGTAVGQELLTTVCHPPSSGARSMYVVPVPKPLLVGAVFTQARAMIGNSTYDVTQLLLAGVAAILRQLPRGNVCDRLWQSVHLRSRFLFNVQKRTHGPRYFAGTCAGMVAEAQCRAGADLGIMEPLSPPGLVTGYIAHLGTVVDDLLELLGSWPPGLAAMSSYDLPPESDSDTADSDPMDDWSGPGADPPVGGGAALATRPPPSSSDGGVAGPGARSSATNYVSFGPTAALELMTELSMFGMSFSIKPWWNELQTILNALDRILDKVPPDGKRAPRPGQPVYLPLMSLGLMLDQLGHGPPLRPFP